MPQITASRLTVGAAAALSLLAAASAPAFASGAAPTSKPQLAHTHLTLHATKERVTKNDKFKATVVAKLRSGKKGLAGESVELFQHAKGATKWVDTGTGSTTDANGAATFTFVQSASKEQYRVVFAGDSTYKKSHSGTITITRTKPTHSTSA